MTAIDPEQLSNIQANAELIIAQFGPLSEMAFGYDAASVEWLDGYINRIRTRIEQETADHLAMLIACYLGEAIIRSYGGAWDTTSGQLKVAFDSSNSVFPFGKVEKQFANGAEDSISSFFTLIPIVFASHLQSPS